MWKVQPSWAVQFAHIHGATLGSRIAAAMSAFRRFGGPTPGTEPNVSLGTDGVVQEGVPSPNGRS